MIPPRYSPILFGLILSGLMSSMVSGVATLRILGVSEGFFSAWFSAWSFSWAVAFPAVLIVGPITRRMVARMVRAEA